MTQAGVDVPPARAGLAAMLARIHALSFPPAHRWDEAAMATLLGMAGVSVQVADAAGGQDSAGFIMTRTLFDEAEILTFAVVPAARRQGVGRDLLARCVRQVAEAGATTLFLEVADDNQPAMTLYRAAGFTQVGLRRNYYPDGADACVMQRKL